MMMNSLRIESGLSGKQLRDELIRLYNELCYWSEEHSKWDAQKKEYEYMLDISVDTFKERKTIELSTQKNFTMKEKEQFLNNYWDVKVDLQGEELSIRDFVLHKLHNAYKKETEARHKMNILNKSLDVVRSSLSWDKVELERVGDS